MLTQTFMSMHTRSPAKVHPLYTEWVYKYRLEQRDRTDTNLPNGVHARFKGFSHTQRWAWADSAHTPMIREGVKLIENHLITLQNQKLQTLKVKSYIKKTAIQQQAIGHSTEQGLLNCKIIFNKCKFAIAATRFARVSTHLCIQIDTASPMWQSVATLAHLHACNQTDRHTRTS